MTTNEFLNDYYVESFDKMPDYTLVPFKYRDEQKLKKLKKDGLTLKKETYLATQTRLNHCLTSGGGYDSIEVEPDNLVIFLTQLLIDYKILQDRVAALEKTVYQLSDNCSITIN